MYVISVVETDRYASSMSVHNESATSIDKAYTRKVDIIHDAMERGEWELWNDSDWATWLHNTRFPDRLCFIQITTCFPAK